MNMGAQVKINTDTGEIVQIDNEHVLVSKVSEDKREEFEALCRPLIKFLNDNFRPHVKAIIEPDRCELVEGLMGIPIDDYILD